MKGTNSSVAPGLLIPLLLLVKTARPWPLGAPITLMGTLMGSAGPKNQAFPCNFLSKPFSAVKGQKIAHARQTPGPLSTNHHRGHLPLLKPRPLTHGFLEECSLPGLTPTPPFNPVRPTPRSKDLISDLGSPLGMGWGKQLLPKFGILLRSLGVTMPTACTA